jgi:hypothetical protein
VQNCPKNTVSKYSLSKTHYLKHFKPMKAKIFVGPPSSGKSIVANMIESFIGRDKTYYKRAHTHYIKDDPWFFDGINDKTELIILDGCKDDFPYHLYFPPIQKPSDSEIFYPILVNKPRHWSRIYLVKNVILITNSLDFAQKMYKDLLEKHFDIIHFPIPDANPDSIGPAGFSRNPCCDGIRASADELQSEPSAPANL